MAETFPINIWINEERFTALKDAGLGKLLKEELAGMKVLIVPCTGGQRDKVLKLFPMAKFDAATTKSVELLPKYVKDKIYDMVVKRKNLEVMDEFLAGFEKAGDAFWNQEIA
jgi:sorbitol-specific phosphotransferase system component IIBC